MILVVVGEKGHVAKCMYMYSTFFNVYIELCTHVYVSYTYKKAALA